MFDLKITGGTIVDGTGAEPLRRRRRHHRRHDRRRQPRPARRRRHRDHRRHRPHRHPRLRRHPLPLRRPGLLRRVPLPQHRPRRHHRGARRVRHRLRPRPPRRPRDAHPDHGVGRGHPRRRAAGRAAVGAGRPSPSSSTPSTGERLRGRHRRPHRPRAACARTSWARRPSRTGRPPRARSPRWPPREARPSRPAPSASRPPASPATPPARATPSPAPTPPRTSCSASPPASPPQTGDRAVFELAEAGADGQDAEAAIKEVDWMRRVSAEFDLPGLVPRAPGQLGTRPVARAARRLRRGRGRRRRAAAPGRQPPVRHAARPAHPPPLPQAPDLPAAGAARPARSPSCVARLADPEVRTAILAEEDTVETGLPFETMGLIATYMPHLAFPVARGARLRAARVRLARSPGRGRRRHPARDLLRPHAGVRR